MKVLLIDPHIGTKHLEPPLGLLQIAQVLFDNGHNVKTTSLAFDNNYDRATKILQTHNPQLIGMSVYSSNIQGVRNITAHVRQVLPKAKIVLGGPHITALPQISTKQFNIDFLITGEGEYRLLQLIDYLELNKAPNISGIYDKNGGIICENSSESPIACPEPIFPKRELLDTFEQHINVSTEGLMPEPCTTVIASKGCFGKCKFCQPLISKMYGKGIKFRKIIDIKEELVYLRDVWKIASIQFADDTIVVANKWGKELANLLYDLGLPYAINIRGDVFNEESAKLLRETNCHKIMIGIESGSNKVLASLNKGVNSTQMKKTVKLCKKYGILTRASVMIGSPGETEEDIIQTIKFLEETRPDSISVNYTKPSVGSQLFNEKYTNEKDLLNEEIYQNVTNRKIPIPNLSNVSEDKIRHYFEIISNLA